jgi:hypothetical protein
MAASPVTIGELREGPLHAALKRFYARPGDLVEAPLGGFVVDILRGDRVIEIQTGGFHRMKAKLDALLDRHPMTIVHPLAAERRIVRVDGAGEVLSTRRSPLRPGALAVCAELVSFPVLLTHPNLTIEVALCREDHVRAPEPVTRRGRRRDPGVRCLVDVLDRVVLAEPADLGAMLPRELPERFTTRELARAARCGEVLARQVLYCARSMEIVVADGRRGRAPLYRRAYPPDSTPNSDVVVARRGAAFAAGGADGAVAAGAGAG